MVDLSMLVLDNGGNGPQNEFVNVGGRCDGNLLCVHVWVGCTTFDGVDDRRTMFRLSTSSFQ